MKFTEKMEIGLSSYVSKIKGEDSPFPIEIKKEYLQIYSSMPEQLIFIFAYIHSELDKHINEANRRYENEQVKLSSEANDVVVNVLFYYKSNNSKKLRALIEELEDIINLVKTKVIIKINDEYYQFLSNMKTELKVNGGNTISNYRVYKVLKFESIFSVKNLHEYGNVMNIIFASNGLKPDIVLSDAIENKIEIVGNKEYSLIYDLEIENNNLTWNDLNNWWKRDNQTELSKRLLEIYKEDVIEKTFLTEYLRFCRINVNNTLKYPALIPEVYLHYDPKTIRNLNYEGKEKRLTHQRMDFLMLINGHRVIVELDGQQHYSENNKPSPKKYAEMISYDRQMKLLGYDVYRFGGYEFIDDKLSVKLNDFFNKLLMKYAPHILEK